MSRIEITDFLNFFDIVFIIICIISIFFAVKHGLIKSFFNLIKWILIIYIIKNIFIYARPIFDTYITNQTIADITIFFSAFIISYILLSSISRFIIGILQPNKSGFVDLFFGGIFGLLRGYIVIVLIFSFLNSNVSTKSWPSYIKKGVFYNMVEYGNEFLDAIPKRIEKIQDYGV